MAMKIHPESRSALGAAWARAYHYANDEPRIFDDSVAHLMLTDEEVDFFEAGRFERLKRLDPTQAALCTDRSSMLRCFMRLAADPAEQFSRARYAEDQLEAAVHQGVRQYVLVGAGIDTFAFRRPDLNQHLQAFEIDRPAAQSFKRQRLVEAGLKPPANLHFVPVDFTQENLDTGLARSTYDPQVPTFFGWLGVTYYLTREAVFDTLRAIRHMAAPGSHLVFDYFDLDAFNDDDVSPATKEVLAHIRNRVGEPLQTGLEPPTLATELAHLGFQLRENCSPGEIDARYFKGRTDGYHAAENCHFAWAVVE